MNIVSDQVPGKKNPEKGPGKKTQEEAFDEIRKEIDNSSPRIAKQMITQYLEKLYDPNLAGKQHFYEQDEDSFPTGKIPTKINGRTFYSTILYSSTLKKAEWEGISKPEHFVGGTWKAPGKATDLLGGQNHRPLHDRAWVDHGLKIWHERIDIRNDEATGYSLYARKDIKEDVWLGQYTGELRQCGQNIPEAERVYLIDIGIGDYHDDPMVNKSDEGIYIKTRSKTYYRQGHSNTPQAICWLDAMYFGSFLRFAAHSCEPNAGVDVRQNNGEDRVIAAYANRDIKSGEKITISYGKGWFEGDRFCRCGEVDCKNPDPFENK